MGWEANVLQKVLITVVKDRHKSRVHESVRSEVKNTSTSKKKERCRVDDDRRYPQGGKALSTYLPRMGQGHNFSF